MGERVKKVLLTVLVCGLTFVQGATAEQNDQGVAAVGAVFAATNDANHNEILMFAGSATGALKYVGKFATGGRGQGGINDPLQSQSSLALSSDHRFLLAVNAGSSTVSVFRVDHSGLRLLSVEPSNGGNPISIAVHDDLLYVANFGGNFHTAGFHLRPSGKLDFIPNSKQPLSTLDTEPWQDVDWQNHQIHVRRRWVRGNVGQPKTKKSKAPVAMAPLLAKYLGAWQQETTYAKATDWVFASTKTRGRTPRVGNMLCADYLRPAAVKAGVELEPGQRFGFHNLRHSLASFLITKKKTDVKTVQCSLRHAKSATTLDHYSQTDMEELIAAQEMMLDAIFSHAGGPVN